MLKFKKKRNVLLIHGAWSNKNSFNYIQELLDHDNLKDTIVYEYNCHKQDIDEIKSNLSKFKELVKWETRGFSEDDKLSWS